MGFKELYLINYCTRGEEEEGLEGLIQGCETLLPILLFSVRTLFREVSVLRVYALNVKRN